VAPEKHPKSPKIQFRYRRAYRQILHLYWCLTSARNGAENAAKVVSRKLGKICSSGL
jgi:hypothetical protein